MLSHCKIWAKVTLIGLLVSAFPFRVDTHGKTGLTAGFPFAYAKDGDSGGDNSGRGSGGDRGRDNDRDDDGGDNDRDNDRDDDRDDDGKADRDDDRSGRGGSEQQTGRLGPESNMDIRYSNGWRERIRNGRYRLSDPSGRTVKDRRARSDDLTRMRQQLDQ